MNVIVSPVHYTPEDLLKMPDGDCYELIDGQLVERNMSFWSSYVGGEVHRLLGNFARESLGLGRARGYELPLFPARAREGA